MDNYSKEGLDARLGASYAAFYKREDDEISSFIYLHCLLLALQV